MPIDIISFFLIYVPRLLQFQQIYFIKYLMNRVRHIPFEAETKYFMMYMSVYCAKYLLWLWKYFPIITTQSGLKVTTPFNGMGFELFYEYDIFYYIYD